MVRRYKQTRKDRRHESEGMKHYEKERHDRPHEGHHEGLDSRFMGMLHEDRNAPANLPQGVVHKFYPQESYSTRYELDDTISGIDENLHDTKQKVDHYPSDSMY